MGRRSRPPANAKGSANASANGNPTATATGSASRRLAIEAMVRIDRGGAYANLLVPELLDRSELAPADRHFVTELVYGATRMRRACDHLVDRFLLDRVEPEVRAALRLGAYQLVFLGTPAHAALDATVGAVRGRGRSVVNAVLRRVAASLDAGLVAWPDLATELSYPDWIVEQLTADFAASFGSERGPAWAVATLRAMNDPATTTVRADGYIQDEASQLVAPAVGAAPGELVIDLCAAPGGKATALAAAGARVVAADLRPGRVRLIRSNADRLGHHLGLAVADGTRPPFRPGGADHVLVDAPCSGLGSLRRRADARWRIEPGAPARLARLQTGLVLAALELVRPGGTVTYSVCTLTRVEGPDVVAAVLAAAGDRVEALAPPGGAWETLADGVTATLLPADNDGMTMARFRRR
ncbi:MAG: transcription antitermination factor NusB [Acidimicrobiales bacterium]